MSQPWGEGCNGAALPYDCTQWRGGRILLLVLLPILLAFAAGERVHAAPLMALPGQYSVTSTGAFTYTIPIQVPPGIHKMAPRLAFTYSSQGRDGYLGLG